MDLDPTANRPGTAGMSRTTTALATDARRGVTPSEVEREAVSRTVERATYTSLGLRPAGDATRDVVVQLSQKPRTKSVDDDGDERITRARRRHEDREHDHQPPRRPIDTRA
jgi:hypothetical protein